MIKRISSELDEKISTIGKKLREHEVHINTIKNMLKKKKRYVVSYDDGEEVVVAHGYSIISGCIQFYEYTLDGYTSTKTIGAYRSVEEVGNG